MGNERKRYSSELQAELIRLARSGRSIKELARQYEPSEQSPADESRATAGREPATADRDDAA